jgi:hypothetical protein
LPLIQASHGYSFSGIFPKLAWPVPSLASVSQTSDS